MYDLDKLDQLITAKIESKLAQIVEQLNQHNNTRLTNLENLSVTQGNALHRLEVIITKVAKALNLIDDNELAAIAQGSDGRST